MLIPFSKVCHDFLAARGESPDLLPVLEDGEDSAVLTFEAWLRVMLVPKAVEATLAVSPDLLDDITEITLSPTISGKYASASLPPDFLRFLSLSIGEIPVPNVEIPDAATLRFRISPSNYNSSLLPPNSSLSNSSLLDRSPRCIPPSPFPSASLLTINPLRLRYIPYPYLDSSDILHISSAALNQLVMNSE